MKLHSFVKNSINFLLSEEFNESFWLTYLALGIFGVGCMAFFFIPPVFFVGIALVLTPLVIYGALWAGVGMLKVIDLIMNPSSVEYIPLNEYAEGDEIEDFFVLLEEPEQLLSQSYDNPRRALVDGYKPQFVGATKLNTLISEELVVDESLRSAVSNA